jgi:hypothetical protein
MNRIAAVVAPLRLIDWDDLDTVESVGRKVLEEIDGDRTILRAAVDALSTRPHLLALCEHPDPDVTAGLGQQLDKIVLYSDDDSGVRVRLHAFWPGHYDLPHNHRWSFVSLILRGGFQHSLFGPARAGDVAYPVPLEPVQVRQENTGTCYALHHDELHALVCEPGSVSLVIRGPAVKDRSFLVDPATGRPLWHVGAAQETLEEVAGKQMTAELLAELSTTFATWGLF